MAMCAFAIKSTSFERSEQTVWACTFGKYDKAVLLNLPSTWIQNTPLLLDEWNYVILIGCDGNRKTLIGLESVTLDWFTDCLNMTWHSL
jgi:hypothetical protein